MPGLRADDINMVLNAKSSLNGRVNIVSYDLVLRMFDQIRAKNFKVI